jgi:CPA2 family monovalent cation:H+ antiporter-2
MVGPRVMPWLLRQVARTGSRELFTLCILSVALGIILLFGFPLSTALTVSASLAQIGEFSFILGGLGVAHGLLTPEGLNLILAGALLSITVNPLAFRFVARLAAAVGARPQLAERVETRRAAPLQRLQTDLDAAHALAASRQAAHRTFTPEELAERFPLFASLTAEQREVLVLHVGSQTAQPGERIIRAGDAADAVYVISKGEVEVAVAGQRIKLHAGDFFGEMALISHQPRSADVTALDYSTFAVLSQRDFRQFLHKYPEIGSQIASLAAQREESNRLMRDAPPSES